MAAVGPQLDTDPLTGLPGYQAFLADLEAELSTARENDTHVSIALIDIDWFGKLNERLGQTAGDSIVESVSARIERYTGEAAKAYRYGGDALMLTLAGTEKEQAFLHAETLRRQLEGPCSINVNGKRIEPEITISCGVAAYPDDGAKVAELIRKCSEALYRAKVSGRNKVCFAREEKMVTKTTHYTQGQLEGLSRLAKREGLNEATLLREALDDLLRKHNS